jgi:hypothetical protein
MIPDIMMLSLLSVLLYGQESCQWPVTPSQLLWLQVFHHRYICSILGARCSDSVSKEELLRCTPQHHIGTNISRLQWLGHVMCMPGERVARQVLFGQLRGTRPVGSSPVSSRSFMSKDVLLLSMAVGVNCMTGAGINSVWRRLHGGLVLIRCFEVFRSFHPHSFHVLEIHWNGSQGPP